MSDIFLSYVKGDRESAAMLGAFFQQQNLSVRWGSYAIPGPNYADVLLKELADAKVVLVLWSREARYSYPARAALKGAVEVPLVIALLEKVEVPFEFKFFPTFDISEDAETARVVELLQHLRAIVAASSGPAAPHDPSDGLPEAYVTAPLRAVKTLADSRPEGGALSGGVFISYRRVEAAAYAGRLYDRLATRFGRERVFIDMENVGVGEDFVDAITAAAESCAVMVVLISRRWSRGEDTTQAGHPDYVRLEVATALGRKIRVIPILIQGASMPAPKELPEDLAPLVRRNALALSDTRWERDVEDLIKTLERFLKA